MPTIQDRISKAGVKLTPDTIVAAWNAHNGFGDVSVKDVYLQKLGEVDFRGKSVRNLIIPEVGYTTVYKNGNEYSAVDTQMETEAIVEEALDKWDDLLTSKGYTYTGESEKSEIYYASTKSAEEQPVRIFIIKKWAMMRNVKAGRKDKWLYDICIKSNNPKYNDNEKLSQSAVSKEAMDIAGDEFLKRDYIERYEIDAEKVWPYVIKDAEDYIKWTSKW